MGNYLAVGKGNMARDRGQSLVEFALVLPIMLLLIMGIFDLGRLFYIKIALNSAAREGAYYLSYNPGDYAGPTNHPGTDAAILNEANNLGVRITPATDVVIGGSLTKGQAVEVRLQQTVNLMIFNFITGPVNISSSVRMLVQ